MTYLTLLYIIICISDSSVRGGIVQYCNNYESWTWNYTQEELARVGDYIYDVTVSQHTGNVYIAHGQSSFLVLKKGDGSMKQDMTIQGNINSIAVDSSTAQVYIGSFEGVEMYNEKTGIITPFPQIQKEIWKLFTQRNSTDLYTVVRKEDEVYRFQNFFREEVRLNIRIDNDWSHKFVVDTQGNYFYTTQENEVFVTKIQLKGFSSTITFTNGPYIALAVDTFGRVFGTSLADLSVYHIKPDCTRPHMVTTLDFKPRVMYFDNDNNPVFGTTSNKVIIFKIQNNCTPAATITELDASMS